MKIFVRESRKNEIDADQLFEVINKGIQFFAEYTKTPFPWKKYDQIFCPQLRVGAEENTTAVTFSENWLQS